ncbi:tyrosine-type recombinase/integrase (plasmid) [Gordonia polyisoprenivorans]|uniref:tyrosine-type recombinase/integrase n=1 Tax=Gordonia polyisoprenivorans TaxID=84595 RepID=UPI002234317D|nr:tyrosine-type recombinase/integrase [uncultured Gordonia sp.]UZF59338.1 tyrosine-type recombinase/integrase [Gordonia polyisoprenivorans]
MGEFPISPVSAVVSARTISETSRARLQTALDDVLAPSTRRAYERHWRTFEQYCAAAGYTALPAEVEVVGEFLHFLETTAVPQRHPDRVGWSVSSISQALAAIRFTHQRALAIPAPTAAVPRPIPLWDHPQLDDLMRSIRHRAARSGRAAPARKRPLLLEELTTVLTESYASADTWRRRLYARRDAAVLLLGWAGAMRRSEIVALHAGDLTRRYGHWTAALARSKTDQAGHGMLKALPVGEKVLTCPPCAVVRWLDSVTASDTTGRTGLIRLLSGDDTPTRHVCDRQPTWPDPTMPVFRRILRSCVIGDGAISGSTVGHIVQRRAAASGIDIDPADLGAHSLRAGFVTQAVVNGTTHRAIQRQTGHKSLETLMTYAREHDIFDNNAATDIGL